MPFDGREQVRSDELFAELETIALQLETQAAVKADFAALVESHKLSGEATQFHDYVRVRLAFELTRDGGLWGIRWDITNESPNSEKVWAQLAALEIDESHRLGATHASAVAECDELSALTAYVARRLGVRHLGLFWPEWNHVVTVWTTAGAEGEEVRVVLPTSQIWLESDQTIGTRGFNPYKQRHIYEYRRRDLAEEFVVPVAVARAMVRGVQEELARPADELQAERNRRSRRLGGS